MSTFVLIHGGWHGAWCWQRVARLLREAGHRAVTPDLPGHGEDSTQQAGNVSEMYVPSVCEVLDNELEPVILVGHSSGGMIISEAANERPHRVRVLVYLSAFLLPPGKSPRDAMHADTESILQSCLIVDGGKGVSTVRPERAKEVFYSDCADEDAAWAISRLQPEPLIPPRVPVVDSRPIRKTRESETPKVYIECLRDRALGPAMQKKMYSEIPCQRVYSLPTSHSPFLSAPRQLVSCLLEIDASFGR